MRSQFTTSIAAASALFSTVLSAPLASRVVCGVAPTGSATVPTPLSQPTGITTEFNCAAQCKRNSACLAFLFGLVDGVDKCSLYSVSASDLPPEGDLVAYDIGCTDVPDVIPTSANPGGLASRIAGQSSPQAKKQTERRAQAGEATTPVTGGKNTPAGSDTSPITGSTAGKGVYGTHATPLNSIPSGNPTPIATPEVESLAACLAACKGNSACINYDFASGVCKLFGPKTARRAASSSATPASTGSGLVTGPFGSHSAPLNVIPVGDPVPIATPAVKSLAACLRACKGNAACVNYVFTSGACKLYGPKVARHQTPATGGIKAFATRAKSSTGTHAAPINGLPAGNPTPIAQPKVSSLAACLAACKGNPACVNYVFTSGVCKLFG